MELLKVRATSKKEERAYPSESHILTFGIALSTPTVMFIGSFYDYRICVNSECRTRCAVIITPEAVLP